MKFIIEIEDEPGMFADSVMGDIYEMFERAQDYNYNLLSISPGPVGPAATDAPPHGA